MTHPTTVAEARQTLARYAGVLSAAYPQLTSAVHVVQDILDRAAPLEKAADAISVKADLVDRDNARVPRRLLEALDEALEGRAAPTPPTVRDAAQAFVDAWDLGPEDQRHLWWPADERLAALRAALDGEK